MTQNSLLLIGAGGHARSCIDVIEREGIYEIGAIVGLESEIGSFVSGYPVVASDQDLNILAREFAFALIAIGQIDTSQIRKSLYTKALNSGFKMPTIISPLAYVSRNAILGSGTIVMHGAIVNAGAKIAENCIINSNALIEHDTHIARHCHISTGALINGGVTIEEGSFVGSGAVIKEGIVVGEGSLVGMGASLRHDLIPGNIYLGKTKE